MNSGRAVVAAFPAEGGPIVAWVKPGDGNEEGGALEVFVDGATAGPQPRPRWRCRWRAGRAARRCWAGRTRRATRCTSRRGPRRAGRSGRTSKLADGGSPVGRDDAGRRGARALAAAGSRSIRRTRWPRFHPWWSPASHRGGAPWRTMSKLLPAIAATALVAAVAASPASAWTPPTTLSTADEANPLAQAAFDGSVMTRLAEAARLAVQAPRHARADHHRRPVREGLGRRPRPRRQRDRRHRPQAQAGAAHPRDHRRRPAHDLRQHALGRPSRRSTSRPTAPRSPPGPGTTRRAGARRSRSAGPASRASTSRRRSRRPLRARQRPFVRVAAGEGGRAVLTWQVQTGADAPLHVLTAGENSTFGADQVLAGGGRWADVALAVGASGAVQVAYLGPDDRPDRACASPRAPPALRSASPPSSPPAARARRSGTQVATAFSADGTATVAWGKPGNSLRGRRHARGLHPRARRGGLRPGPDARRAGARDRARRRPRQLRRAGLDDRRAAQDLRPLDRARLHAPAGRRRVRRRPGDLRPGHGRAVAVDRDHARRARRSPPGSPTTAARAAATRPPPSSRSVRAGCSRACAWGPARAW